MMLFNTFQDSKIFTEARHISFEKPTNQLQTTTEGLADLKQNCEQKIGQFEVGATYKANNSLKNRYADETSANSTLLAESEVTITCLKRFSSGRIYGGYLAADGKTLYVSLSGRNGAGSNVTLIQKPAAITHQSSSAEQKKLITPDDGPLWESVTQAGGVIDQTLVHRPSLHPQAGGGDDQTQKNTKALAEMTLQERYPHLQISQHTQKLFELRRNMRSEGQVSS